jgi:hypothetical protein
MSFIVSVYDTDLAYGGPEEGGWWYQEGLLLRIMAICPSKEEADRKARRIDRLLEYRRRKYRNPSGHRRFIALVHEHQAPKYFPKRRPHYE